MTLTSSRPKPRVVVFAGPNGSGKSTIVESLRREPAFPTMYINADDIAREELAHIPDPIQRNLSAAALAPRWPPKLPHLWPPKFPHPGHGAMRR